MSCDLAIFSIWQRCGSTLLQRMAARRPATLVWGEAGRWPNHFLNLESGTHLFSNASAPVRELLFGRSRLSEVEHIQMLANMAPPVQHCTDGVVAAMRAFFTTAFHVPGVRHLGFKEVRVEPDAIRLFHRAFPESQIVLLVRHPTSIWRSLPPDWIDYSVHDFLAQWNSAFAFYTEFARSTPRAEVVHYEDLAAGEPTTVGAVARLLAIEPAHVLEELGTPGHSTTQPKDPEEELTLDRGVQCARYRGSFAAQDRPA